MSSIRDKSLQLPLVHPACILCTKCKRLSETIWDPAFSITYTVKHLNSNSVSKACNLCGLLWRVYEKHGMTKLSEVMFERNQSVIKMNGEGAPVLSIYRSPDLETRVSGDIQIGFPQLPDARSETHFEIMRQWLDFCDHHHKNSTCRVDVPVSTSINLRGSRTPGRMPTRVIAVGRTGDEFVFLHETKPGDHGEWLALSHQWGTGTQFCTTTGNLNEHMNGIKFDDLPATFRDAVTVTRALGCEYLWIDSICIIQGFGGDFNQEAKRMEQVYSGAYCVLASSRLPGHDAGFLQPRTARNTVVLQSAEGTSPFYICEAIDDFKHHVLDGTLNQRGWVLQEHALARRTIYFTEHQTYFECGDRVRCETMIKMRSELATFLGDPNFPRIIMQAHKGERILMYQDLYKSYSRLGLSQASDRPMAIAGLQERILAALDADGGHGVFDEDRKGPNSRGLLRRSLLWRRGEDVTSMVRIQFPKPNTRAVVPSWSWMAHSGGIDYISPVFGGVDWEEMQSPWSPRSGSLGDTLRTGSQGEKIALVAEARDYTAPLIPDGQGEIVLDYPGGSQTSTKKCVVLGTQKGRALIEEKKHYLLIVAVTSARDRDGTQLYERVGAGYLPGKCIGSKCEKIRIH